MKRASCRPRPRSAAKLPGRCLSVQLEGSKVRLREVFGAWPLRDDTYSGTDPNLAGKAHYRKRLAPIPAKLPPHNPSNNSPSDTPSLFAMPCNAATVGLRSPDSIYDRYVGLMSTSWASASWDMRRAVLLARMRSPSSC